MSEQQPEAQQPVEQTPPQSPSPKVEEKVEAPLTSIKEIGIFADRNARHRRTMEDEHVWIDGFCGVPTSGYFAIYDGHGGKDAVNFVAKNLHINLENILKENSDVKEAFNIAYEQTDTQIGEAKIMFSGTTTISALLRVEEDGRKVLYTANCGDARAVLCRNGKAIRLSLDHKASDEEEIKRIQKAGGFVVMNRVNGVLAVARSLGDRSMKDYVSGEPFVSETVLEEGDTHLILACDGVWDVISDQDSVDFILKYEKCQDAAKNLLIHSIKSGSTDNISVMVIRL